MDSWVLGGTKICSSCQKVDHCMHFLLVGRTKIWTSCFGLDRAAHFLCLQVAREGRTFPRMLCGGDLKWVPAGQDYISQGPQRQRQEVAV